MKRGFTTQAIHYGFAKKDPHGALRLPIYDNAAFEFDSSEEAQAAFEGKKLAHVYSRSSNPTVEDFERRVCVLAGAESAIGVASGMAAITNVIWALAESGTNLVASPYLFGNTYALFASTFKGWGLDVRFVNMKDLDAVASAIDAKTRGVFLEVISNPQMQAAAIRPIAEIAHAKGVPLILDGTLTSPYLFRAGEHGVDIEVLSTTKFISGGGTSIGGLILDYGVFPWKGNPKLLGWSQRFGPRALTAYLRKDVYRNSGSCLSAHSAYLQTLGLETLALRVDRSCQNAMAIAKFLEGLPGVKVVHYPGLESSPDHHVAKSQFPRGFGALLSFELAGPKSCFALMDKLQLIRRATNLCDNKTLIIHPASTIYSEFSPEERKLISIPDTMLRLSVGIEDVEDLLEDLKPALAALR